jgi:hypothetical protein
MATETAIQFLTEDELVEHLQMMNKRIETVEAQFEMRKDQINAAAESGDYLSMVNLLGQCITQSNLFGDEQDEKVSDGVTETNDAQGD